MPKSWPPTNGRGNDPASNPPAEEPSDGRSVDGDPPAEEPCDGCGVGGDPPAEEPREGCGVGAIVSSSRGAMGPSAAAAPHWRHRPATVVLVLPQRVQVMRERV